MTTMWALAIAAGCGSTKVPLGTAPGPTVTVSTTDDTGSGVTEDSGTTTSGDSGGTDPDDSPPVDSESPPVGDSGGPAPEVSVGPTDWDAVHAWMEEYAAQIRLAGACPTVGPDKVVQLDGSMAALALEAFEPVDTVGQARVGSPLLMIASEDEPSGVDDDDMDCHEWTHDDENGLTQGEMSFAVDLGTTFDITEDPFGPPYVFIAEGDASRNDTSDDTWDWGDVISATFNHEVGTEFTPGAGYALVCLDAVVPPDGLRWGEAPWVGSILVHTEYPGYLRSDIVWSFDQVACGYAEDAGVWVTEWSADRYHSHDCDGIDNDLDGEIDEGAQDRAGNGIADCLEGILP